MRPDIIDFINYLVRWGSFFGISAGFIFWGFKTCDSIRNWAPPENFKNTRRFLLAVFYPFLIFTDPGLIFREDQNDLDI